MDIDNLYKLIDNGIEYFNKNTPLVKKENNQWIKLSWLDLKKSINSIAKGLLALGLNKSNTVCLLSKPSADWLIIDMAILSLGGITVPIYYNSSSSRCEEIINHSEARFVFVEDEDQLGKILSIKNKFHNVIKVITIKKVDTENPLVISLEQLEELGNKKNDNDLLKQNNKVQGSDIATIVYTSGATSSPKGVVLTHHNIISQVIALTKAIPINHINATISYLPLSHIVPRCFQFLCLYNGICQWFAKDITQLTKMMQEAKPQLLISTPKILEKIVDSDLNNYDGNLGNFAHNWAYGISISLSQLKQEKQTIPLKLKIKNILAKPFINSKLKKKLGGRLELLITFDSFLSENLFHFFNIIGTKILEGYSLTETTGITHINQLDEFHHGKLGQPLNTIESKTDEKNEILIRGSTVMLGYYKNESLTHKMLDVNGWLHTEDLGNSDDKKNLILLGKKIYILQLDSGKIISPEYIENIINASPFISNSLIYRAKKSFVTALLVLDRNNITQLANKMKIPFQSYYDLLSKPEILKILKNEIDKVNNKLDIEEKVEKFAVLEQDLSIEVGELTATLKLRRFVLIDKHKKFLDQFYQDRFN